MSITRNAQEGVSLLLQGDLDGAERRLQAAEREMFRSGLLVQACGITLARAQLALIKGDREAAERLLTHVRGTPKALDDDMVRAQYELVQARLAQGAEDAQARVAQASQAVAGADLGQLRERFNTLAMALPNDEALQQARIAGAMADQIGLLAAGAWELQLAWAAFKAGDWRAGMVRMQSWISGAKTHQERAMGHLVMATGLELNERRDEALIAATNARTEAVKGREVQLYQSAALSMCRLYQHRDDKVEMFLTATRAWKSLDQLLGEGAGGLFRDLLVGWRQEWGEARWQEAVAEATRRGGV
ncbi:MAG: hypothetical protein H6741_32345 [Alphaproteobacteria bacterium]|nr:hypothetical protein [Alphaproteobacteria bacterium]